MEVIEEDCKRRRLENGKTEKPKNQVPVEVALQEEEKGEKEKNTEVKEGGFKVRENPKGKNKEVKKATPKLTQSTDGIRCGDRMVAYGATQKWGDTEYKCVVLERPYQKNGETKQFSFSISQTDLEEVIEAMTTIMAELE